MKQQDPALWDGGGTGGRLPPPFMAWRLFQSPLRSVSPQSMLQSPLRSVSPQSLLQSPLRSVSPQSLLQSPLRSVSPQSLLQSPLRSVSPHSLLESPLRSGGPQNPLNKLFHSSGGYLLHPGGVLLCWPGFGLLLCLRRPGFLLCLPRPGTPVCLFLRALFHSTGLGWFLVLRRMCNFDCTQFSACLFFPFGVVFVLSFILLLKKTHSPAFESLPSSLQSIPDRFKLLFNLMYCWI